MKITTFLLSFFLLSLPCFSQSEKKEQRSEDDGYKWVHVTYSNYTEGAEDTKGGSLIPASKGFDIVRYEKPFLVGIKTNSNSFKYVYYTKTGNEISNLNQYDAISLQGGENGEPVYFQVFKDGKCGICNDEGVEIIPTNYNKCFFSNGAYVIEDETGDFVKWNNLSTSTSNENVNIEDDKIAHISYSYLNDKDGNTFHGEFSIEMIFFDEFIRITLNHCADNQPQTIQTFDCNLLYYSLIKKNIAIGFGDYQNKKTHFLIIPPNNIAHLLHYEQDSYSSQKLFSGDCSRYFNHTTTEELSASVETKQHLKYLFNIKVKENIESYKGKCDIIPF